MRKLKELCNFAPFVFSFHPFQGSLTNTALAIMPIANTPKNANT